MENKNDLTENLIQDKYLIKSQQINCVSGLNIKKNWYTNLAILSSQQYYNNLFRNLDWKM